MTRELRIGKVFPDRLLAYKMEGFCVTGETRKSKSPQWIGTCLFYEVESNRSIKYHESAVFRFAAIGTSNIVFDQ